MRMTGAAPPCRDSSASIVSVFAAAARADPGAIAVRYRDRALSYRALDLESSRLAGDLAGQGLRPGDHAALHGAPSDRMVVAILAVLKAGAAYVPLDRESPPERLGRIVRAARPRLLLAAGTVPALPEPVQVVSLDVPSSGRGSGTRPAAVDPLALAYVMFTSGSTGEPKGVMVAHASVVALARSPAFCAVRPGTRVLLSSNLAFDGSVFETFGALLNGGTLVVADEAERRSVAGICRHLRGSVDVAFLTTALFNRVVDLDPLAVAHVDCLLFGGQAASPAHVARAAALQKREGALVHVYGPTETTVFASFHPIPRGVDSTTRPPIGQAVGKTALAVLDSAGAPCPPGRRGEIFVAGPGVALGYLGDPGLTAERFVPDPARPGRRRYRTGDFGHWDDRHALVFDGRGDGLVKIRGYRVEIGEVEGALRRLPGVRDAQVRCEPDQDGEDELVAYLELHAPGGGPPDPASLREMLPAAMIPGRIVIGRFALNANGKIDIAGFTATPPPARARAGAAELDALRDIWSEVLGRAEIGDDDDFFLLGGHSLRAATLLARINTRFGVDLALREVFDHPVLSDLAAQIAAAAQPDASTAPDPACLPLTQAQAEIWPLARNAAGAFPAFHIPEAWLFEGPLDHAALAEALRLLVARHDALRTEFIERDGGVTRRVRADAAATLAVADFRLLTAAEREARVAEVRAAEAHAPFAFDRAPLLRAKLLRLDATRNLLLLTLHHLVADGWSVGILRRDLAEAYLAIRRGHAPPAPPAPARLPEAAPQQADPDAVDYFRRTFASGGPNELPSDLPRPGSTRGTTLRRGIDLGATRRRGIAALAAGAATTPFVVCAALVAILLRRQTAQREVSLGFAHARREQPGLAGTVGSLARLRPLRVEVRDEDSGAALLARLHAAVSDALRFSDVPIAAAIAALDVPRRPSRPALFDVVISFQDDSLTGLAEGAPRPFADGVTIEKLADVYAAGPYDLAFAFHDTGGTVQLRAEFDSALFTAARVERMLAQVEVLAQQLCERPQAAVGRLEILGPAERATLDAWGEGPPPPIRPPTVLAAILARAEVAPDRIAVSGVGGALTWRALVAEATAIARELTHGHRVRRGEIVLLAMDWSVRCAPAVLGIWMAGAAFFAWDPKRSARGSLDQARAAGCRIALGATAEAGIEGLTMIDTRAVRTAREPPAVSDHVTLAGEDLAYVISTTGSSGEAKLVLAEHRSLTCWAFDQLGSLNIAPGDRVMQGMSLLFDPAIFLMSLALAAGAELVWCEQAVAHDAEAARRFMEDRRITVAGASSGWLVALGEPPATVRALIGGGEPISGEQVARIAPGRMFVNQYGPSEAGCVTAHLVDAAAPAASGPLPIGRPLPGVSVLLLDDRLERVPIGVPGALWVSGQGVARGYLNRPDMTAEAFRPHPDAGGARMYRTGDDARYLPDGLLQFMGRRDRQEKVRGYRVDLNAVATLLESVAAAGRAAVLSEGEPGKESIVAFLERSESIDAESLGRALSPHLPDYMLPARYVAVPAFPAFGNGKLDLPALRALGAPLPGPDPAAHGGGDGLETINQAFARILDIDATPDTDFFRAGGDSLKALRLVALLQQAHGDRLTLADIFALRTPRALAEQLGRRSAGAPLPPLDRAPREASSPATAAQLRLWIAEQAGAKPSGLVSCMRVALEGALDTVALERGLALLVARHEALRTRLIVRDGAVRQIVEPTARISLARASAAGAAEADALARQEATRIIDLDACPTLHALLVERGGGRNDLVLAIHHAHCDGDAAVTLLEELRIAYDAFARGREPMLAAPGATPRDYAAWERTLLDAPTGKALAAFWRGRLRGRRSGDTLPGRPAATPVEAEGAVETLWLTAEQSRAVRALAAQRGATPFAVVMTALAALARRHGECDDVLVGFPASLRQDRLLDGTIGCFVNPLPLPLRVEPGLPFGALLDRVRAAIVDALNHRHYPFDRMVADAGAASRAAQPLFQLGCTWAERPARPLASAAAARPVWSEPEEVLVAAKSDFWLHATDDASRLRLDAEYRPARYGADQVLDYLGQISRMLEIATTDPETSLEAAFREFGAAPSAGTRTARYTWGAS